MKLLFVFFIFPFFSWSNPKQITTTFSILSDIAFQLLPEDIMIHSLSPNGVDPHSYKPTSQDMLRVSSSQLLIYFGNGIDSSAYKMAKKSAPTITECQAYVYDQSLGLDPHAWQSPTEGIKIVNTIADCLKKLIPEQATSIEKKRTQIDKDLQNLTTTYKKNFAGLPESSKKILTAHQAFGFLAHDFGLKAYSVLGSDSHDEPSAQKLQKLVNLVTDEKITTLFPESVYLPSSLKRLTTLTSIQVGPVLLSDNLPKDPKLAKNYQEFLKYNLEQIYQTLRKSL